MLEIRGLHARVVGKEILKGVDLTVRPARRAKDSSPFPPAH